MIRLIPKNSKLNYTIKNLTLLDVAVLMVILIIAMLVITSNFFNFWINCMIAGAIIITGLLLVWGEGDSKTYLEIAYIFRYLVSRKKYVKNTKKKFTGDISELIPFKSIRPDGVVVYDGYVGAVIEVGSVAFKLLDETEQDRRISEFAAALNNLGISSVMQLVKIDRPINYDKFSEELFEKLNEAEAEEKTAEAKILKSRLSQIDYLNNVAPQFRPYYYLVIYEDTEEALLNQVDVCLQYLDRAVLPAVMLEGREVALFFKYSNTRGFDERDIEDLNLENAVDFIKPESVTFRSGSFIIDGVHAFTFAIKDYPLVPNPCNAWGASIFNLENTKVVMTIKPVEKSKSIKRLDRAIIELKSQERKKESEQNTQFTHLDTMREIQNAIMNENEMLFDTTVAITAYNYTEKPDKAFRKDIRRQIVSCGFGISDLFARQYQGFAASTAARTPRLKICERGINSESLAGVFPFVFSTVIEEGGFMLGVDDYPVILNMFKRGGRYVNSNAFIAGMSGGGKSYFMKLLICMAYSENSRIFILDPENEYQTLAHNVGGAFIDVGNAVSGRINPLHVYSVLTDEGIAASPEITFSAHLRFLADFFKITLSGITSDALEELNNLILTVYEKKGITEATDCTELPPTAFPVFDDVYKEVCVQLEEKGLSPMRRSNLERVKTYMQKFASGGMYSALWNGQSTLVTDEKLVVFNFQSLFGAKNNIVAAAQMLVVMRYLDRQIINIREENRNSSTVLHPFIVVDEGYNFIDPEVPTALQFIYLWFKRIRKYEGAIVFTTQNFSDVLGNSETVAKTTAILNNAQYSFIFSLGANDVQILNDLYRNSGGLNEIEQASISHAGRGDCFAICSSDTHIGFRVVADEEVSKLFMPAPAEEFGDEGEEIFE